MWIKIWNWKVKLPGHIWSRSRNLLNRSGLGAGASKNFSAPGPWFSYYILAIYVSYTNLFLSFLRISLHIYLFLIMIYTCIKYIMKKLDSNRYSIFFKKIFLSPFHLIFTLLLKYIFFKNYMQLWIIIKNSLNQHKKCTYSECWY